ncbi:MAG: DUF2167 domain-containing protein [Flavobacterium sp.]|nr:DUF2167 domain-containing protein [Flavobacterium sp.]
MRKFSLALLALVLFNVTSFAGKDKDSSQIALDKAIQALKMIDSVKQAMKYETGIVKLEGGFAQLNIPKGFKFLNAAQSKYVLTDLWGNPERDDILGIIFPEQATPFTSDSTYAFVVSYDEMGFVKDDDAKDVKYDDLMKEMQKEEKATNEERAKNGYESIHIIGWASTPFYDDKRKVLHWAKEIKFGEALDGNTLNYDVRILGRKGVLSLNAIANMKDLSIVKADIDNVLNMASFTEGNTYDNFDASTDKIAVYTIGGLVAGKVLAKVGFWVLIAKFWKLILAGLIAVWYAVKRFFLGKSKAETATEEYVVNEQPQIEQSTETTTADTDQAATTDAPKTE